MCEAKAKALPRGDVKAKASALKSSKLKAAKAAPKSPAAPKSSGPGPLRKRDAAADPPKDEPEKRPPLKRPAASGISGQFFHAAFVLVPICPWCQETRRLRRRLPKLVASCCTKPQGCGT